MRAYRQYLIKSSALSGIWWIEKDGHPIAHAKDEADAKRQIDELLA